MKTIAISFGFLRGADIIGEGCIRLLADSAKHQVPIVENQNILEEILVLRRVWITLRQQLHECLSPDQGRVVGQLLK